MKAKKMRSNYQEQEKCMEKTFALYKDERKRSAAHELNTYCVMLADRDINILQQAMDAYCEEKVRRFKTASMELSMRLGEKIREEAATGILSQYYPYGISPQTRLFREETYWLSEAHSAEMRELAAIYNTLGLKTNRHLEGFPLHRSPKKRCAPQGV